MLGTRSSELTVDETYVDNLLVGFCLRCQVNRFIATVNKDLNYIWQLGKLIILISETPNSLTFENKLVL